MRISPLCAVLVVALFGARPDSLRAQQSPAGATADTLMAHAVTLRRLNRKAAALADMRRALEISPGRVDLRRFRDQLQQEVHGLDVIPSVEVADNAQGPSQEAQLSLRKNTASGPFIVRGASVRQFGVRDEKIDVEAYPAFRGGYLTLAGSRASSGRLYAQSMLSALLFKSLPGQFEASAGYRRLNFSSPVSIATASIGNYFRDYQFGVRVNRMAGATHGLSTSASARQYLTDDGQYIGLIATVGSVRDQIRTAADLGDQSNKSVAAEAMFVLASRWIVSSRASIGLDELSRGPSAVASSLTLGFGVRF